MDMSLRLLRLTAGVGRHCDGGSLLLFQQLEVRLCAAMCLLGTEPPWKTLSLYTYIYMPISSFDGPLLGFKKSRSRGQDEKPRQKRAEMRKKTKHWNMKKPHTKTLFTIKLGKIENLTFFVAHWLRLWPHIYIYINPHMHGNALKNS